MITPNQTRSRQGFTLTELLIGITVMAILIGMLAAAVIPALIRAREATILFEIKQMELSIEQFKNDYGFYPPSFERGFDAAGNPVGIQNAADLARYINRIAPNNAESTTFVAPGVSYLQHWYDEMSPNMNQETSLVFWLSGLCKNKQYPLTGNISGMSVGNPPLAAHGFANDGILRDVRYEFKAGQLDGAGTFFARYRQAHGADDGNLFYKYRDAPTYDIGATPTSTVGDAYRTGPQDGSESVTPYQFANPNTFQLICFGMDGKSGAPGNWFAINKGTVQREDDGGGMIDFNGFEGTDNLTNFAEGRLEKWVGDQQ